MSHDQTFPGPSGLSINLRVHKELLPTILYGYAMSQLLHYIVNTHLRHPDKKSTFAR